MNMENTFTMVAKTFKGLEPVLRDELLSLEAQNVEMGNRMVSFEGDLELMYRANLSLRTALRILKPIEKFTARDTDELYDIVRDIEWEKYMSADSTFAIDATVNSSEFTHSRFVTYRVKDGIVDHFRDLEGDRPSIRVSGYDFLFNVHIDGERVTISLDSSGEPLSKRGYREESTEAPINEVLAAGIIMTTGWRGDSNFIDPMCGSGTFLIEAALIAANINPGIYRKGFAFEKWPDFDNELFEELYNDDSAERPFDFKIYGGDIDAEAVAVARKNIKNAQVDDMVEISCRPMADWIDNPEPGCLVMNPPYGHRLKQEDLTEMFRNIGNCLKRNFPGWNAWIIGPDIEDFDNIGLKPSMKIPLLNGSLECSLREYVLFDGYYNDFRAKGGTVKGFDDDYRAKEPKKMRRISEDEWKSETRKFGDHKPKGKPYEKRDNKSADKRDKKPYDKRDGKPYEKREGKPFDNRDGKPYEKREGKPFNKRDGKPFEKREGKPFNKRDGKPFEKRDGKPFRKPDTGIREITDNGPKISRSKETVVNSVYMRSRKSKSQEED